MSAKAKKPKRLSVIELKAQAYDTINRMEQCQVQIQQEQNTLRTLNAEINRREQMPPPAPKKKESAPPPPTVAETADGSKKGEVAQPVFSATTEDKPIV